MTAPRIGQLRQTSKGWAVTAPAHCPNGHELRAGRMVVGHQACASRLKGGHTTWTCLDCDGVVYAPTLSEECVLLHGAATVRNL